MLENGVLRKTFVYTTEKYCIVRGFKICTSYQINIRVTRYRGKGGQSAWNARGRGKYMMGFGGKM
jgi:hypothetical protein